jgi:glycosyltransferase involved in cell wall biosynthesis
LKENNIDVSVVLITCNQEKYVQDALNSIVSQQFSGKWEVIIADDCSTDDTYEIIKSYQVKYPDLFYVYSNDRNLGLALNYQNAIKMARGKYIAYLEGDDYWTDSLKLVKQFEFLEKNPNCVLSFHDFLIVDNSGIILSDPNTKYLNLRKNRTSKEMITGCLIHQNTIMFRNIVKSFPKGFLSSRNHDTFFIAYLSKWGEAGFVECFPLHYRQLENSLWSSQTSKKKHFNGIITYFQILLISSPIYYFAIFLKILSKSKALLMSFR